MIGSYCASVRFSSGDYNLRLVSMHASGPGIDSNRQQEFFEAVKKNEPKVVRKLLKKRGVDVNFLLRFEGYGEKMTALHYGTLRGKLEAVTQILRCKKVQVDIRTPFDGSTALHFSCTHKDKALAFALAKALVHAGAQVNCVDNSQKSALILAAERGHVLIVRLLVERGADLDHMDHKIDDVPCLATLSSIDTALKRDPAYGNNSLIQACRFHHTETVKELLRSLANVKVVNTNKSSALHVAADLYFSYFNCKVVELSEVKAGNPAIASMLIQNGVDVNARDMLGLRPLARLLLGLYDIRSLQMIRQGKIACYLTALRMAQILVRAGADVKEPIPNRSGKNRNTVLNRVLMAGEFLLKYGNDYLSEEFSKLVRMLITLGSPLRIQDAEIATSLNLHDVTSYMLSHFDNPVPLKLMCVASIRQHTKSNQLQENLQKLNLPEVLKQLVCLQVS